MQPAFLGCGLAIFQRICELGAQQSWGEEQRARVGEVIEARACVAATEM